MKIVHVETGRHFYGGAQQVIWLMEGLVAAGVECHLVCPPSAEIASAAEQAQIPATPIDCAGDHDLRFAWRLRAFLRDTRPDLVHCHSRRGADLLGGRAARSAGVPAILSRRVDNPEAGWLGTFRYRPFAKIIAISSNIADLLAANGLAPARMELIRDAVDADCINSEPSANVLQTMFDLAEGSFTIAVVGQLIKRKGHRFLLDVLPGLCHKYPQIKVVFFGVGPEEENLKGLTRKLGLSGAVTFAGFRLDIDDYLAAFDLLVHPAEQEGLGVAMLKGAAAELPVVAFDVAGAQEAVQHGKTDILIPPGDLDSLLKGIELLIEEPEMRSDFGKADRQRMLNEFSVTTMVDKHMALYRQVLNA